MATEYLEEWRPVKGYENSYEVSSLGRVRSLSYSLPSDKHASGVYRKFGIILNPRLNPKGYLSVCLRYKRVMKAMMVKNLVANTFGIAYGNGKYVYCKDGNNYN